MSIINALTTEELKMFDAYRIAYANGNCTANVPSAEILEAAWAPQKERYLYPLLGHSLIYQEPITYELSEERILDKIYGLFLDSNSATAQFVREFNEWRNANIETLKETGSEWYVDFLLSPPILAQNVYNGLTFFVNCPNGKVVKVQQGCRPVKTLLRILNMWGGLPHQDAFREEVSVVLTQKRLHGTLCLSIHPLDYATMSDNNNDWSSCMSWEGDGCYRAGTVEMMNSEAVVVAYLSNTTMSMPGDGTWNSKMWRQLMVVSPKGIFGVKAYPYQNEHLTDAALHALANLAEQNLGWKFDENTIAFDHNSWFEYAHAEGEEPHQYCFSFKTGAMYNDFGTIKHRAIIASDWNGNVNEDGSPKKFIFNYSGPRQCMSCGSLDGYFNDTVDLACQDCDDTCYCSNCGERIYDISDMYEVDGDYLCEYCFENNASYDILDELYHYNDNMSTVYVLPRDFTEEELKTIKFPHTGRWENCGSYVSFETHKDNVLYDWARYFTNKPVAFEYNYGTNFYVLADDVNDSEVEEMVKDRLNRGGLEELPDMKVVPLEDVRIVSGIYVNDITTTTASTNYLQF